MERSVIDVMDAEGRRLEDVEKESLGGLSRLTFLVMATRSGHRRLNERLTASAGVERVLSFRTWEEE
jgi:putative Mg2+ transporter-C (MgtC) family protein